MKRHRPVTVIEVRIWGMRVGALAADPASGYFAFEYDPAFAARGMELSPLRAPVSIVGPFVERDVPEATFHRLPTFVADALPDKFGNALIDAWMIRRGLSAGDFTVLDRLAYMGARGMGALEFRPALEWEKAASGALEAKGVVEAARKAVRLGAAALAESGGEGLLQLMRVGTSAGGAKAKAVIGFNHASGEVCSGQFDLPEGFEPWLLKINTSASRPYGCVEYAYYLMAVDCGIEMAESRLMEIDGAGHFMTRRFDRAPGGEKIHAQTLCAMAGMDFNQLGTHDYLQVFDIVERLGLGFDAVDQLFLRMAFNVCMANNDDHAKNHSFLLERGGRWRLAPAYDMMFASNPANKWTARHAMGVNGAYEDITREAVLSVGRRHHVRAAAEQLDRVLDVAGRWQEYAEKAGVDEVGVAEIGAVIERCARLLR